MKKTSFLLLLLLPVAQIYGQVEVTVHNNKSQNKGLFISETPSIVEDTFRVLSIQSLNKKEHSCEDSKWNETYIIHIENEDGIFVLLSPSTTGITYKNEIKVSDSCFLKIKPYNNHDYYPKHGIFDSFFIHEVCYKLDYGRLWFQNIYTTENLDGLYLVTDSKNKGDSETFRMGCKIGTNYIIQELTYGYGADYYPPFACIYRLKTDYNLYYITDEDYLLNAIAADSINLDSLTYLVPHFSDWDIFDSVQDKYTNRVCFSKALYDIMTMDNTEVYKIGSKYYAIKKIRYAYLDDIEVYKSLYYIICDGTDDIQIEKEEEEYYRTTYKTIEDYLPNRKYQYYLFLLDICETDKAIKEHLWKRKYELNDFWIHTLRKPE